MPDRRQDQRHVYCGNCEGVDPDTCINAVSPVPGQQREAVARWLEREYVGLIDDESWQGCLDAADELLALLAATQDGGQA